jgi:hypothetical protein
MVELVRAGLAAAQTEWVAMGPRTIEVARVRAESWCRPPGSSPRFSSPLLRCRSRTRWLRAPADRDQLFRLIATTHSN